MVTGEGRLEDKISIIVPCFKAEKYIATILCDVRAQRYANWELLVVGNGPGQQIQADIVRRVSAEDSRVRYLSVAPAGVSCARNFGIEHATGDWIAVADADDRVPVDWLLNFSRCFPPRPDMIAGGIREQRYGARHIVEGDLEIESDVLYVEELRTGLSVFASNLAVMYSPCSKIFRRDFLLNSGILFDTHLSIYEDGVFCLQLALKCRSMSFVRQTGYVYCIREGSAIGRYHENLPTALKTRRGLLRALSVARGDPEYEVQRLPCLQYSADALDLLLNTFRSGSPFGFASKVSLAKELIRDEDLKISWSGAGPIRGNAPLKLFKALWRVRSASFCVCVLQCLLWAKRLVRRFR